MTGQRRVTTRTQPCDGAQARKRLADARLFLELAETVDDASARESLGVSAANAVLAALLANAHAARTIATRRSLWRRCSRAATMRRKRSGGSWPSRVRPHHGLARELRARDPPSPEARGVRRSGRQPHRVTPYRQPAYFAYAAQMRLTKHTRTRPLTHRAQERRHIQALLRALCQTRTGDPFLRWT
jgi:hypothetical protein